MEIIDSNWLLTRRAPYILDKANETYVLETEISTQGSAFGIVAGGITLDLNHHSVEFTTTGDKTVWEMV